MLQGVQREPAPAPELRSAQGLCRSAVRRGMMCSHTCRWAEEKRTPSTYKEQKETAAGSLQGSRHQVSQHSPLQKGADFICFSDVIAGLAKLQAYFRLPKQLFLTSRKCLCIPTAWQKSLGSTYKWVTPTPTPATCGCAWVGLS